LPAVRRRSRQQWQRFGRLAPPALQFFKQQRRRNDRSWQPVFCAEPNAPSAVPANPPSGSAVVVNKIVVADAGKVSQRPRIQSDDSRPANISSGLPSVNTLYRRKPTGRRSRRRRQNSPAIPKNHPDVALIAGLSICRTIRQYVSFFRFARIQKFLLQLCWRTVSVEEKNQVARGWFRVAQKRRPPVSIRLIRNPARACATSKALSIAVFHRGHFLRAHSLFVHRVSASSGAPLYLCKGSSTMVTLFGQHSRAQPSHPIAFASDVAAETVPSPAGTQSVAAPHSNSGSALPQAAAPPHALQTAPALCNPVPAATHGAPLTRTRHVQSFAPSPDSANPPVLGHTRNRNCSAALHPAPVRQSGFDCRKRPVRANLRSFVCQQIFRRIDEVIRHARSCSSENARSARRSIPRFLVPAPCRTNPASPAFDQVHGLHFRKVVDSIVVLRQAIQVRCLREYPSTASLNAWSVRDPEILPQRIVVAVNSTDPVEPINPRNPSSLMKFECPACSRPPALPRS